LIMVKSTMFIEAQANLPGAVKGSLEKLVEDLKKEGVNIIDHEVSEEESETIEGKEAFSSFVEMSVDMPLRDYIKLCMRVTPSSMEVLDVDKEIDAKEMMFILGDVCRVVGKICQSAGVRIPVPDTQFGDERQEGPEMDEDEFYELLDNGYIQFKFVAQVAGDREIIARDTLRVLNVFGAYVNKIKIEPNGDQSRGFVGLAAIEALVPDLETLFEIVLRFSPVAMTIEHPEVLRLSELEIQNLSINLSSLLTDITNYVTIKKNRLMANDV